MKRLYLIGLLFLVFIFPSTVHADIAPPIFPPGSNLQPGSEATQVRMAAETVLIDIQKDITPDSLGRAHVTADFTMHNQGTADESMAVRFPLASDNGRIEYPEISNIAIMVNGKQVPYRRASYPDVRYPNPDVPWAEFDVTFPAGQDLPIRVSYDLNGSGYYPFTAFYYVLQTGAGWKDTIGSALIILRLPYKADPENVILNTQIGWAETTPGGAFQGNEVRWYFENFEPGGDDGTGTMEFALVAPSAWEAVLRARAKVDKNPRDGEAWGMLAKAYKQIFFLGKGYREDSGGQELYSLSLDAYERCLLLRPRDAQWHAGFADLLAKRATWESSPSVNGPTPEMFRALNEIHTALTLAPYDPIVRQVAQDMVYMSYGGITQNGSSFDFPWLTQTPTALPSTPTVAPATESAVTPLPPSAATNTPPASSIPINSTQSNTTPVPQASNPICGATALIPLFAMAWFIWKGK